MAGNALQVVMMEGLELYRPPVPLSLRPYVEGWSGYRERTLDVCARRELPISRIVTIIEFGPPIQVFEPGQELRFTRHQGGFVAGLDDRFTLCRHDGYQAGVELRLTPRGARTIFGVPLSELAGRAVHLTDLLPREQRSLGDRLASCGDWSRRLHIVEALLLERIRNASYVCRKTSWALHKIEQSQGRVEIEALARELGMSRKHLATLFRDGVGFSPKAYASLVRFEQLVEHLKVSPEPRWVELALRCGYADQAHLSREVKRYSGSTPSQLLATLR